jgi:ferric-dicitrate binding protein FerR (iron transport regulator)
MSGADCNRWMGLADQAAAGNSLTDKDQAWLVEHASVCHDCAAEKQFYSSLRDALGRPEMLVVGSQAAVPPVRRAFPRRPLIVALALAASVAIAVGGHRFFRGHRPARPVASPALTAQVVFASGEAVLGLAPAEAGHPVPQGERLSTGAGSACMGIADSIDVCLEGDSAAIFALGDPNQILVYLEKGTLMARLEHQPGARKFFVRTAGAEVQAVGTRFSVHLADDGNTRVRLHEGRLAVRAASRISTDLAAPVQASIAQDIRVAPISPAATGDDKPLADLVDATREETGAALIMTSTPAGADVLVDYVAMGKTPLSMFLGAAAHVRLSLSGYQPVSDWIDCDTCATSPQSGERPRIVRAFTLTPLPASSAGLPEPPAHLRHAALATSPDKLLAKAQSLRAHGRYDACAHLYRRLWSQFPSSEEAKVSMISLGELELVHTKNPGSALDAFNAYLHLGGPLDREARFGKIRALRALDRHADADVETARFLRDYPAGIQAATLRRERYGK